MVLELDDILSATDPDTNSANFVISMGMPTFSFGLPVNGIWGLEITSSCALDRVSRTGGTRTLNIMTCVCVCLNFEIPPIYGIFMEGQDD